MARMKMKRPLHCDDFWPGKAADWWPPTLPFRNQISLMFHAALPMNFMIFMQDQSTTRLTGQGRQMTTTLPACEKPVEARALPKGKIL